MKTGPFSVALILLFCLAAWAHHTLESVLRVPSLPSSPNRIVSLAPSVTETLYALGIGDKIVGVTQFCAYPPEVRDKPQVAGFGEVNHEAVLRLRPDLVVLPQDKIQNKKDLESLGLPVLTLDTRSVSGLMNTMEELGKAMGHTNEARAILARINKSLTAAQTRAGEKPKQRVLFSVMHSYQGLGYITEINAVGKDGFYSELIRAAGGNNVYTGELPFPRLSREAIIFLNPEVIIDIIPASENLDAVCRDWQSLSSVSAIKNNRLYLFTDEADTVPGPRFHQTLTKLSHAFYPDPKQEAVE
ncbi:MAG: ABC transporter substrate-binding protein [Desulfovibrio sp.]|jgi:iron complex transport system substrate-binding protein|nr:ABC transporter substrate-binding protein [Desulfovibrio sp.]